MGVAFVLASCSFPTTFTTLWQLAAFCGVVLSITTCVIFWQRRSLKAFGSALPALLIGTTFVGGIWAFALAIVTSWNYLDCAGFPGASADQIQRAEASYQTLLIFQSVVTVTCVLTVILVLLNMFALYFVKSRNWLIEC